MSTAFVVIIGTNMLIGKPAAQSEKLFRSYVVPMDSVPSLSPWRKLRTKCQGVNPTRILVSHLGSGGEIVTSNADRISWENTIGVNPNPEPGHQILFQE